MTNTDIDVEVVHSADCGAVVEWRRGIGWADHTYPRVWRYVCRMSWDDDNLITADYHYVEGEEQRHYQGMPVPPQWTDCGGAS